MGPKTGPVAAFETLLMFTDSSAAAHRQAAMFLVGALVTYLLRQSGAVGGDDGGEDGGSGLAVPAEPQLRKPSSSMFGGGFKG